VVLRFQPRFFGTRLTNAARFTISTPNRWQDVFSCRIYQKMVASTKRDYELDADIIIAIIVLILRSIATFVKSNLPITYYFFRHYALYCLRFYIRRVICQHLGWRSYAFSNNSAESRN